LTADEFVGRGKTERATVSI